MNPDIPASSSDASQHSAMPLQRSRADILKPLCIAYARAAAKLASTAVATDRSLSGSAHVTLLPPPTEDHAPDGATVDMYDVAEPIDRPLVDLLNVIRNLTAMGRKLDVDSQHQPSLASRTRSDVDHELSAPCLHGGVRLTRAEILQTRADLEAQREVLESIQRTMSGRSCPLPICDPSSPPSLPSLDRVGDASSEAAPSPEVEQQLDAVRRREQQWKLAAEAAVVAARAMKEAAHVTRMGAAAEIASWQQTAETAVRTLTRAETEILSWQQQATTAMRRLDRAETAAAVEKVEAEDLLRRLAELELENTRLEESSMSKQFDEEAASKEREARFAAAERKIAAAAEDLKALTSTVSQALGLSVGGRTRTGGGTAETTPSEITAAAPAMDVVAAAASISELVRELEEMIVTTQAESLGRQCLMT